MAKRVSLKKQSVVAPIEAPQAEAPQAETPQAETPQVEAPQVEAPQTETIKSVDFQTAFVEVKNGNIALTKEQYIALRLKMVAAMAKGDMGPIHTRLNEDWAAKEYSVGGSAIEGVLRWVWDKYIGNRIGNQMIANIIFQMLIKGVDNAYAAILRWLRGKTPALVNGIEEGVKIAAQVAEGSDLEQFKAELEANLESVLKDSAAKESTPKAGFLKRIWIALKSIFS